MLIKITKLQKHAIKEKNIKFCSRIDQYFQLLANERTNTNWFPVFTLLHYRVQGEAFIAPRFLLIIFKKHVLIIEFFLSFLYVHLRLFMENSNHHFNRAFVLYLVFVSLVYFYTYFVNFKLILRQTQIKHFASKSK